MYDFQKFLNPGKIWGLHPNPDERDVAELVASGPRILMRFDISTKQGFEVYRMVCQEIRDGLDARIYVQNGEKEIFPVYEEN